MIVQDFLRSDELHGQKVILGKPKIISAQIALII
jgi:hypothetical protein